jgi:hypothetical protein
MTPGSDGPTPADRARINPDEYVPGATRAPANAYTNGTNGDDPAARREARDATRSSAPDVEHLTLVIASRDDAPPRRLSLDHLVRVMGLDLYGRAGLSRAARLEMKAVAMVLLVVFLFDVFAWSLLFYFLFNAGSLALNWTRVVFALGGVFPALLLLLYERGIMTADTSGDGLRRLALPTVGRISVILVSAYITAVPIELVTFGRRIERRVHEELIRKDLATRYTELREREHVRDSVPNAAAQVEEAEQARKVADDSVIVLSQRYGRDSIGVAGLAARAANARSNLAVARAAAARTRTIAQKPGATDAMRADWEASERRVLVADSAYRAQERAYGVAKSALDLVRRSVNLFTGIRDTARIRSAGIRASVDAELEVKRLRQWARTLRALPPGASYHDVETNYDFQFVEYDFIENLRVIDDQIHGRPPRWAGVNAVVRDSLAREFGLDDGADPLILAADAHHATRIYRAVFWLAVILPLMTLLFKAIMSPHLKRYYSNGWQRTRGNADALALDAGDA